MLSEPGRANGKADTNVQSAQQETARYMNFMAVVKGYNRKLEKQYGQDRTTGVRMVSFARVVTSGGRKEDGGDLKTENVSEDEATKSAFD